MNHEPCYGAPFMSKLENFRDIINKSLLILLKYTEASDGHSNFNITGLYGVLMSILDFPK